MEIDPATVGWTIVTVTTFLAVGVLTNYIGNILQREIRPLKGSDILLVTAHPDDECMFFGPFIIWETNVKKRRLRLLCLSDGNHYGQGATRSLELMRSCVKLGLSKENCTVLEDDEYIDAPDAEWDAKKISELISAYCDEFSISTIVSFDSYGVSGHLNHISIYKAFEILSKKPTFRPRIYMLHSLNLFRKYNPFFNMFSLLMERKQESHWYFLNLEKLLDMPQNAMKCHVTQLVWFRYLYMHFSSYMRCNIFKEMPKIRRDRHQ